MTGPTATLAPVRVNVTAAMLDDLDTMQRITAEVLGRLGCGKCHSGRVLDFRHLEEFTVNPETLEVLEVGAIRR